MTLRYSHPPEGDHDGVLLSDHLEDVAERARLIVPSTARTPSGDSMRDVVESLAYVHDFGKASTFFQQYLGELPGTPPNERFRYHAPVGAFAAFYALDSRGFDTETCLAGFVAVGKHHGSLPDVMDYVYERSHRRDNVSAGNQTSPERQQTAVAHQLEDINEHTPNLASEVFEKATDGNGTWDAFYTGFRELLEEIEATVSASGTGVGVDRESLPSSCYALVLECWGSLVFADKTSAASASRDTPLTKGTYAADSPRLERLHDYIEELEANASADPTGSRSERLNHFRSRAQSAITENALSFADGGGGIATITLPTGMGKTLAGMSAALSIRDRLGGDRVVYALPFTSIIDQVVDETAEIFEANTEGRLLTAHHHLASTTIQDIDEANIDEEDQRDDVAGMLAESWRAGLTVTTFVQLFESLAGPANTQSMKIPALRDSVVILDEPQSLPLDWWKLVPRLVTMLTDRYGVTVIVMTATQPQLFDDAVELVDDPSAYFDAIERVRYQLDPSTKRYMDAQEGPKSYDTAVSDLIDDIEEGASTLAICNTIDSARKLTGLACERAQRLVDIGEIYAEELDAVGDPEEVDASILASRIESTGGQSILHLSTRLRPIDRLNLIDTAKELTAREHPLLTISTQLVEAGVDISFSRVYRDIAPIDSIVQAAGRCNRSFERNIGEVTIWWLDAPGDQKRTPAEAVYNRGVSLLPVAARTLEDMREDDLSLDETTVARDAVQRYYEALHKEKNVGKETYAGYVDEARGDQLKKLSLIDQRKAIDVIVCRSDEERAAVGAIRDAMEFHDFDEVNRQMDYLRTRQISVPIYSSDSREARELADLPPVYPEADVRYIDPSRREFADFFDPMTGFVVPDSTIERRFL